MVAKICSVEGCDGPRASRDWCAKHYTRWKRTGKLTARPIYVEGCSVDGCESRHAGRGYCKFHLQRWRRTGSTEPKPREPKPFRHCSIEGCDRRYEARGYCSLHYRRWKDTGTVELSLPDPKHCSVNGCDRPYYARTWCNLHWNRWRLTGTVEHREPKRGPDRHNWKGDEITYRTAHGRIWKARGLASSHDCVDCGHQACDWSYDNADFNEKLTEKGLLYSTDPDHYDPRCKPCHASFDKDARQRRRVTT